VDTHTSITGGKDLEDVFPFGVIEYNSFSVINIHKFDTSHPVVLYISMVYFNTVSTTTIYNYSKGAYIKSWQHVSVVHSTIIRP